MMLEMKKAQRSNAWLKLGLSGASGSGKTLGGLLVGYGLMKKRYPNKSDAELWDKIAIIDSENGSGELYVGSEIGQVKIGVYNAITLSKPFEADKYSQAIDLCEKNGIEVCIIDSTTHLWSGVGGLLEQQGNAAKRSGNSYTAWRDVTPQHNNFIDKMLQCNMHIIATMRAKQEYVQEKDEKTGKSTVRKLGMEPEQRKGMEYEFTTFLEINAEHEAFGAKDRTSIFDQKTFKITPEVGEELMNWLSGAVTTKPVVVATDHVANSETAVLSLKDEIIRICKVMGGKENVEAMDIIRKYANGSTNPNIIGSAESLKNLKTELVDLANTSEIKLD